MLPDLGLICLLRNLLKQRKLANLPQMGGEP